MAVCYLAPSGWRSRFARTEGLEIRLADGAAKRMTAVAPPSDGAHALKETQPEPICMHHRARRRVLLTIALLAFLTLEGRASFFQQQSGRQRTLEKEIHYRLTGPADSDWQTAYASSGWVGQDSVAFNPPLTCATAGAMTQFGTLAGVLPINDWTSRASQLGFMAMGVILSFGLGIRLRRIRQDLAEQRIAEAQRQREHEFEKRSLIERQSRELEARVQQRTAELATAREKAEGFLANILPQAIIEELNAKGTIEPRRHEEVSILFTDFSGFTEAVATIPAKRLVQELDEIFRVFDASAAANGLEKIKTIGDAYMAAAGLPVPTIDHAARCVRTGLALTRFIEERNRTSSLKWNLRVGVHSGAVVAGVVGKNKYAYDVWGDTVNLASRMESASERNRVNISAYTYDLVRDRFDCEYRNKLAVKGKGEIDMYFVLEEKPHPN